MPQIEFRENKVLKLTNVLSRKVPGNEFFHQDKQVVMLQNWIKAKGYEAIGPLIIYSKPDGVDESGQPLIDCRLMLQLKTSSVRLEEPYRFDAELRITNCLLARFNDEAENLRFASNKLTLFAYENDLELTGETYMVMLKQQDKNLLVDVFMPLK